MTERCLANWGRFKPPMRQLFSEFNVTHQNIIRSLLLSCLLAFASDLLADDDGTWTYNLSGDEATITGCVATCPTELVLPALNWVVG